VDDIDQRARIAERYTRDHPDLDPSRDTSGVVEYFDFADTFQVLLQNASMLPEPITKELRSRSQVLGKLASIRNRVMHSRPLIAGDFETAYGFVTDVANASAVSSRRVS
jgi:hypothetical protein